MISVAEVNLWGTRVGAVSITGNDSVASFEYAPAFLTSGMEISPLTMPLSGRIYRFPALPRQTFHGLPGLLADSLPDRFGNALVDAWLESQGRRPDSFNAVERLCYTGRRGMGALEFAPATGPVMRKSAELEISRMVELASEILTRREDMNVHLSDDREAMKLILMVGTSAGGARAKALISWNPESGEVRSGQVDAPPGFTSWLLKFDGVKANRDRELADPLGYGVVEYTYYRMAGLAGIRINECRLLEEGGRRHFATRRFDRPEGGGKLHMQSLGALAHYDFNTPGTHSYEQAFAAARRLNLGMSAVEELYRRMVFNIVARNQDDHVKNIAFLMNRRGLWSLAPAFDITWSFNPQGAWTSVHQMSMNGIRDDFTLSDFRAAGESAGLVRGRYRLILEEVCEAVAQWPELAGDSGVEPDWIPAIRKTHRLRFNR